MLSQTIGLRRMLQSRAVCSNRRQRLPAHLLPHDQISLISCLLSSLLFLLDILLSSHFYGSVFFSPLLSPHLLSSFSFLSSLPLTVFIWLLADPEGGAGSLHQDLQPEGPGRDGGLPPPSCRESPSNRSSFSKHEVQEVTSVPCQDGLNPQRVLCVCVTRRWRQTWRWSVPPWTSCAPWARTCCPVSRTKRWPANWRPDWTASPSAGTDWSRVWRWAALRYTAHSQLCVIISTRLPRISFSVI